MLLNIFRTNPKSYQTSTTTIIIQAGLQEGLLITSLLRLGLFTKKRAPTFLSPSFLFNLLRNFSTTPLGWLSPFLAYYLITQDKVGPKRSGHLSEKGKKALSAYIFGLLISICIVTATFAFYDTIHRFFRKQGVKLPHKIGHGIRLLLVLITLTFYFLTLRLEGPSLKIAWLAFKHQPWLSLHEKEGGYAFVREKSPSLSSSSSRLKPPTSTSVLLLGKRHGRKTHTQDSSKASP